MKKVLFLFSILAIFSCSDPVPLVTIDYLDDGEGFIQYKTNNRLLYEEDFWHWEGTIPSLTEYRVNCKKISGAANIGYGLVFCGQDDENFYLLTITTQGRWAVWECFEGFYYPKLDWADTAELIDGYNVINEIQITRSGTTFTILFNGNSVIDGTFIDTSFSGGQYGFITGIGTNAVEDFPFVSVDTRFQIVAVN